MDSLLHRRADAGQAVQMRYEHDDVPAQHGDTVVLALLGAGILHTSHSVKYRRPRGAYCLRGDCGSCLVRIDGTPNQRACLTAATPHMRVESQNRILHGAPDPSPVVDRILKGGMDHHHFMVRPKIANKIMQGVARGLTGLGTLPDRVITEPSAHEEHTPDVLIVGGGPAGRGAYEVLGRSDGSVLWVDRRPANERRPEPALLADTGVFGVYPDEGLLSAMTRRLGGAPTLHTIRPRHVLFATGATDPTLLLPNNDLPGVVSARGLIEQLRDGDTALACSVLVVGRGPLAQSAGASLGCRVVEPDAVAGLHGHNRVEEVELSGGERIKAQIVALAPTPTAAYELARQGGAQVRWDGTGFGVSRDAEGRCHTDAPWTAWVCGDAAGYHEGCHDDDPRPPPGAADVHLFGQAHDAQARDDGRRVAGHVLATLRAPAPPTASEPR
ncbi:MAG: 2Fe-2S iron-sulfur cluster-binding protein [Myxococcota bacterium]